MQWTNIRKAKDFSAIFGWALSEMHVSEESYEIGSVYPSILLSVRAFSWNWIFRFLLILAWCWKSLSSCVWQSKIFWKNFFRTQRLLNWAKSRSKIGFFNLKKISVINVPWICYVKKIDIICCVLAQICEILFLRYSPKCSQPFKLQDF